MPPELAGLQRELRWVALPARARLALRRAIADDRLALTGFAIAATFGSPIPVWPCTPSSSDARQL
jgi:hypothetical protein